MEVLEYFDVPVEHDEFYAIILDRIFSIFPHKELIPTNITYVSILEMIIGIFFANIVVQIYQVYQI